MTAIASDSFDRANGALGTADTGQTWWSEWSSGGGPATGGPPSTAISRIISNQAAMSASPLIYEHAYIDVGVDDYIVEADLTSPENGGDGVLFRLQNLGNYTADDYYYWAGNFVWRKSAGAGVGQVRTVKAGSSNYGWPVTPSSVHVKVECSGTSVKLWADGVLLTTDSPGGSGGSFTAHAAVGSGVGIVFQDNTGAGLYRVDNFTVDDGITSRGLVVGSMALN